MMVRLETETNIDVSSYDCEEILSPGATTQVKSTVFYVQ